jgi:hypothetical protein
MVAAQKAVYGDEPSLAGDRREGRCLLSYRTPGGWVTMSKAILTEVLGEGRDATIGGLPDDVVNVLKLTCPDLVAVPEDVLRGSSGDVFEP